MEDSEKGLKEELSVHFAGHYKRLEMLSKLILGILKLGTISYSKLSKVINPNVQRQSNFKRIQRFVKSFSFNRKNYIQLVWSLFVCKENWVALSIDRTNWQFGKSKINILMIGISYKGTAIPLIWKLLDKKGNSNTRERIELVNELLEQLCTEQKAQIKCLLGDREFIGKEWISYLKKQPFNFMIRIKANTLVRKMGQHKERFAKTLFGQSHFKVLRKQRIMWGHRLFIAGQQLSDKEWLILISDQSLTAGRQFYGERWGIEVLFGACKTRGFNFEDTPVVKQERLFNLMFLIALAFIGAIKTGEWLLENGYNIPIKKLKNRTTKLYSIFRVGFEHLQELLINFIIIKNEIRLLSCT